MIELTRAVFPVPGEPEIYMLLEDVPSGMEAWSMNGNRKSRIAARSASRPAISLFALLHVERSSARARAWTGRRALGGVGGGVVIASSEISVTGVDGENEADLRPAKLNLTTVEEGFKELTKSIARRRDYFGCCPSEATRPTWRGWR